MINYTRTFDQKVSQIQDVGKLKSVLWYETPGLADASIEVIVNMTWNTLIVYKASQNSSHLTY